MRIKKIIIQAFGPFKDKVEIDFEKNNISKGLLLITGDTGSGKTSIFDAICFALYGEASSNTRKVNTLRSDFAKIDLDTFVELTFEHNSKVYTVKRSPEYQRPNKRGKGITKSVPRAEMKINGRIETKTTSVTKEIEELLGLDYKQFHQVSMLSQGEFTKFLLAGSDEKTSIFRKIFNTDIYNLVMFKLKDNLSLQEQKLMLIKNSIDKEKAKVPEYSFLNCDEILVTLKDKIENHEKIVKSLKQKRDILNEDIKKKQSIFDKIEELNTKIQKYKTANRLLCELLQKSPHIDEEKEITEYNRNIVIEVDSILKELENNKEELKSNNEKKSSYKKILNDLEKIIKDKEKEFDSLDKYDEKLDNLNNNLNNLNKRQDSLNTYDKLNQKLNNLKESYRSNNEKYNALNQVLLTMQESYYMDIAYSLVERLENGKPCPVCGSTVHPSVAKKTLSICSKEEIDAKEKLVRQLSQNKKSYEDQIVECKKNIAELNFAKEINVDEEKFNISAKITNVKNEINKLKENNKALIKEKEELTTKNTKLITELKNIQNNILKYTKNIELLEDKLTNFLRINQTSLEEYNAKKLDKNDLLLLETKIKDFDNKKLIYETTLNSLSDVKDKFEENIEDKKEELSILNKKFEELDTAYLKIHNELVRLSDINENLKNYYKSYKEVMEEYSLIKKLSDTANGKLIGKQKITFENYVQSYYLKSVLTMANKRLMKMTDGRYELKRKDFGSLIEKIGLEFLVFDAYTGKERDVTSLSGGEKFKASLALALGLSDVISMYAGGIKMDCLFIDEGFGSLDQESLNQALNTLTDLVDNDKLIGIISHVSELISKIDNKIIVKKENNGSYISIVS